MKISLFLALFLATNAVLAQQKPEQGHTKLKEQQKLKIQEELMKNPDKLAFLLCTTSVSMYTRDQEHKDKAKELITQTTFEHIKKNPNKAFEKYLMKAVNGCIETILGKTSDEKAIYIQHIINQNYDEIKPLIDFDDDLFRFGGELELTEAEAKIKNRMQQLKDEFDQEGGNDPSKLNKRRTKLSKDLESKLAELKQSRNQNFYIFGAMLVTMVLFSVYICRKGKGAFGNNEELLKSAEFINSEKEKLANLKKKLQEMEKILIAKMTELELKDEVARLNKEEEEANSKIKNLKESILEKEKDEKEKPEEKEETSEEKVEGKLKDE